MTIAKLVGVGPSICVIIPAAYRRELGWIKGDYVGLAINKQNMVVRNLRKNAVKTRKTTSGRGSNELTRANAALRKTPR